MPKISIHLDESDIKHILQMKYSEQFGVLASDLDVSFSAYETRDYADRPTGGHAINAIVTTKN
jgi:hypothetical protein